MHNTRLAFRIQAELEADLQDKTSCLEVDTRALAILEGIPIARWSEGR
eukprot:COSAG05_NODE_6583_length_934_cov_1.600000_1_plen_48_part_00